VDFAEAREVFLQPRPGAATPEIETPARRLPPQLADEARLEHRERGRDDAGRRVAENAGPAADVAGEEVEPGLPEVLVRGRRHPIAGTITMDQLRYVDVRSMLSMHSRSRGSRSRVGRACRSLARSEVPSTSPATQARNSLASGGTIRSIPRSARIGSRWEIPSRMRRAPYIRASCCRPDSQRRRCEPEMIHPEQRGENQPGPGHRLAHHGERLEADPLAGLEIDF